MAVVNTLGTLVSNYNAVPRILSSGYLAGANDTNTVATVAAASTDSIGSTYRFAFLPSGVRIIDIQMQNDATTAGVWQMGVLCNTQQALNMGGPGFSVQTWSSTVAYVPGNVVQFNGVIYYCTTGNTNSQPPSGNWTTGGSVVAAAGSVPIPNAQLILGGAVSTAAAKTIWTSVYSPTVGAVAQTASNVNLRIWELLGMVQDPEYMFHLVLTATTAPTANGNISLQLTWAR
jgi:hypothetical protein